MSLLSDGESRLSELIGIGGSGPPEYIRLKIRSKRTPEYIRMKDTIEEDFFTKEHASM
jgi:hypothetical protein